MPNLFAVPDKERNFQQYMVFVLTLIWCVVIATIVSLGLLFLPEVWPRWVGFIAISFIICIINLRLNSMGYVRTASWTLTIMLWMFITLPCFTAGGIMAPGILTQLCVILTAGFLLGWRGGLAIGLITLLVDFGMVYLEMQGRLPAVSVHHTPVTRWIGAIIPFGTILALQYYFTRTMRSSLEKAKESEQLLRKITSQLPASTYMFEIAAAGETKILFANMGADEVTGGTDLTHLSGDATVGMIAEDRQRWLLAMTEAYNTGGEINIQYRVNIHGSIHWRSFRATPEKLQDGRMVWYGAAHDITDLVEYIVSMEQIIFDIGHVIRRPVSTMLGLTELIRNSELQPEELKELSQKLHIVSGEMDKFIRELNLAYNQKRKANRFDIDLYALIDKRHLFFEKE